MCILFDTQPESEHMPTNGTQTIWTPPRVMMMAEKEKEKKKKKEKKRKNERKERE